MKALKQGINLAMTATLGSIAVNEGVKGGALLGTAVTGKVVGNMFGKKK